MQLIRLNQLHKDGTGVVWSFQGSEEVIVRLREMGIKEKTIITMLSAEGNSYIIRVEKNRYLIGKGVAKVITVVI